MDNYIIIVKCCNTLLRIDLDKWNPSSHICES